jgi:cytochrome oxidase Cu insertion factor (SCO1/SenC/PrrC family)
MSQSKTTYGTLWTFLLIAALSSSAGFMGWRYFRQRQNDKVFFEDRFAVEAADRVADLDGKGFGPVATFHLTDHRGKPFSSAQLLGKVWIADFIFTNCAGPCPAMSAEVEKIRDELASSADLAFVSISVDPKRDTPEVLAKYAESYGGARNDWFLLTGDLGAIAEISHLTFRAGLGNAGDPNEITHSTRFFLVDRKGILRGRYMRDSAEERGQLREDVKTLLARKKD